MKPGAEDVEKARREARNNILDKKDNVNKNRFIRIRTLTNAFGEHCATITL